MDDSALIEIQQSDWLAALVWNSIDHSVENHVLNTIVNDLNSGLLSFRHLEVFWHTQENVTNT